ncbi:MAG: DUF4337 domain-containing protein [Planctomycetes bacterium]|nr:DUF4337 domain-containing protein [Planctomycetota bacterium]
MQKDQFSAMDLQDKGFFFAADRRTNRSLLVPKEGQMNVSTNQGVVYDLKFGDVFSGTEEEVEVGFASKEGDDGKKEGEENKSDEAKSDDTNKDEKKSEKSKTLQKSRYLFVMVHFDEEALGGKPEAPVKPEPPVDPPAVDPESAADASSPTNTEEDPKKVYEAAVAKYEADQKKFETDEKAFEQKVKDGEKLVKELNSRFADWYYVVSGESFESLRQGKKTLIKAKEADKKPADSADGSVNDPPTPK